MNGNTCLINVETRDPYYFVESRVDNDPSLGVSKLALIRADTCILWILGYALKRTELLKAQFEAGRNNLQSVWGSATHYLEIIYSPERWERSHQS